MTMETVPAAPDAQTPAENDSRRRYGDYAGFFTRLVAFLIDAFVIAVAVGAVTVVSRFVGDFLRVSGSSLVVLQLVTVLVAAGIYIGYYLLLWTLGGVTIGKRIMGLIIVGTDGGRVTFGMALRRYVGYYLSAFMLLGYFWVILDPRRQAWHDKLGSTLVLYDWPDEVLRTAYNQDAAATDAQGIAGRRRRLRKLKRQSGAARPSDDSTNAAALAQIDS
jgi:uncharacterized RDD family membrane protein YckC